MTPVSDAPKLSKPIPRDAVVIAVLSLLQAFMPLAIDAYLPALPEIGRQFEATQDMVQLTLSLFMLTVAAGQLIWGPISDMIGRRTPLLCGILLFVAGSAGAALAESNTQLIIARVLQGAGGAAVAALARAIASDIYKGPQLARVLSTMMVVMSVAPMLAPIIGGEIMVWLNWRAIFWFLGAVAALSLLGVFLIPETLPKAQRRVGLGPVLNAYAALLRDRAFMGYALCGGFVFGAMFAYISGTPFVYIGIFNVSPDHYGYLFGLNVVGMMLMGTLNRRLVLKWPPDRVLRAAVTITAAGTLILLASATLNTAGLWGIVVPLFFCISMLGIISPNVMAGGMNSAGRAAGAASGLMGALQVVFGAVSGWMVGLLANGTAVPMAAVMCVLALSALAINLWSRPKAL